MTKYKFRLQKVLDYRRHLETEAKMAYLEGQKSRIEAETDLEHLGTRRQALYIKAALSLEDRLAIERMQERIDQLAQEQRIVIDMLQQEEETLREKWIEARKEVETLSKLRDEQFREWLAAAAKEEQDALDEWATLRRSG